MSMKTNGRIATGRMFFIVTAVLLIGVSFWWVAGVNRFQALYHSEKLQLFQFTHPYFLSFWKWPGGVASYIGSFLTQFNYLPMLGGAIYAVVVFLFRLLTLSIARKTGLSARFFGLTFIAPLLLLLCMAIPYFELSYVVGMFVALGGFRILLWRGDNPFFVATVVALTYFTAAGCVWLLVALYVIRLLSCRDLSGNRWILLIASVASTALSVFVGWQFCYTTAPLRNVLLTLTPANITFFKSLYVYCLWTFFPLLVILCALFRSKKAAPAQGISLVALVVNVVCVVVLYGVAFRVSYDRHSANIIKLYSEVQAGDWEGALSTEKQTMPTQLSRALTNMALVWSGRLPYEMFRYRQIGTSGLFPPRNNYFLTLAEGDIYGGLGLVAVAKHCTFEAMVGNSGPKEHNAQCIEKLLGYSMLEGDTLLFEKYAAPLEASLFYRSRVKEEREAMSRMMAAGEIPVKPVLDGDFFIEYNSPDITMQKLLEHDPHHRKAFEYLMGWCMLQGNVDAAKECFDKYYAGLDYPAMPDHYAELMVLYKNVNGLADDFYDRYDAGHLQSDYEEFELMYLASADKDVQRRIVQKYGNTYWFFLNFFPNRTEQ